MKYTVGLIESEEGYAVYCLSLPGCWSQGDTEEEAIANIKEAITEYLAVVNEYDQPRPRFVEIELPHAEAARH